MIKTLACAILCFSGGVGFSSGQTGVDLALEEFVSNNQGVSGAKTTEKSATEDVSYFVFNNGSTEGIFVSRPDLMSDSIWILYQIPDGNEVSIKKVGIAELTSSTMRLANRDGVSGYYKYGHGGAGQGKLIFNSFDDRGQLMALWEGTISPGGADKALFDSIYSIDSNKPEIRTKSVSAILQDMADRKEGSDSKRADKRPNHDPSSPSDPNTRPESRIPRHSDETAPSSNPVHLGFWIAILFLIVAAFLVWKYRRLIFKK